MMEEGALPRSARKLLVDWAKDQDGWVRGLAGEVLTTRQQVGEAALDAIYEQFLLEKGLADGDVPVTPSIEFDEATSVEAASFVITQIADVEGVNALASNQSIDFNPGLTVLFGENGAGKTGYSRILKQLAAVRTAEPILPNVHDSTSSRQVKAKVSFQAGSDPVSTIDWRGESGVTPFTRLSVFDTLCLRLHVDDDLTYVYTPGDLALFPLLDEAIGAIRQRLDGNVTEKISRGNPYIGFFTRGTAVYRVVETIGAATDMSELEALADTAPDAAARLLAAQTKVDALRSSSTAAQLTTARSQSDVYGGLAGVIERAGMFDATAYNQAVASALEAEVDIERLRDELFAAAGLSGEGDQTWQAFIVSGEHLLAHRGVPGYPDEGDECIYCQQELGDTALILVQKYRDFAHDSAQQRATDSRQMMATLSVPLNAINVDQHEGALTPHRDAASTDSVLDEAADLLVRVRGVQAAVTEGDQVDLALLAIAPDLIAQVSGRREAAARLIAELSGQVEERRVALAEATAHLEALHDGMELGERLDAIRAHVEAAKWTQKASTLARRITPVRSGLTQVSKVASEQLINSDFAERFEEERDALRAPEVGLEFPGQKGRAARRKTVPVAKHPSDVLSEGEQKVIGLADFLAEAGLRLSPAPIVFDDPVNSLDYRRIREVTDRIAALAEDRQVIVFTHNIWFAAELLERFEKNTSRCAYYSIVDDPARGTVVSGRHPRWDTVKGIKGKINQLIQEARTEEGPVREALIESAYSTMRSWCEVVVEVELLAGVTQRYQPNVMMTALDKIKVDRLSAAFDAITPVFKKACRITEAHSQPLETLSVRPTLAELEADWTAIQEARNTYTAK